MQIITKRLIEGQDLLQEIKALLKEHDVAAGVVLSAVGGLGRSTMRVPVIEGDVRYIHPLLR